MRGEDACRLALPQVQRTVAFDPKSGARFDVWPEPCSNQILGLTTPHSESWEQDSGEPAPAEWDSSWLPGVAAGAGVGGGDVGVVDSIGLGAAGAGAAGTSGAGVAGPEYEVMPEVP